MTILYNYQHRWAFASQEERLVTSVSQAPGSHVLRSRCDGFAAALKCVGADLGKAGRSRA
ncbi:hypothetical protein MES5069_1000001 [Mesorhizobium escarrei]|uniref:Uncharacterized protein n=1 Tax=Mesorhizobium escarrei TaxID=666018 RepID=A0ABM9DG34_9HYPH|nr:hypothetical protein MES5069_1000001 [Mesorhizobium escarrei]